MGNGEKSAYSKRKKERKKKRHFGENNKRAELNTSWNSRLEGEGQMRSSFIKEAGGRSPSQHLAFALNTIKTKDKTLWNKISRGEKKVE